MSTNFAELESKLAYKFNKPDLLINALTHPSLKQENKNAINYERLEFLGDAILGFVIAELIFHHYPNYSEGKLAKMKAWLVSSNLLVQIANQLDIASYLIINKGEEKSGGRHNPNNLENALEALIAAIYQDSNLSQTKKFIEKYWLDFINNINLSQTDPKSYLQEYLQSQNLPAPIYILQEKTGNAHAPIFLVKLSSEKGESYGRGPSKKMAEKIAAKNLINLLKLNS